MDNQHLSEFAEIKGNEVFNKISRRKIAAVVPVHVFGLPAKIQEIKQVCLKWNLPLIEDAAEALGSKIKVKNKSCSDTEYCKKTSRNSGFVTNDNK